MKTLLLKAALACCALAISLSVNAQSCGSFYCPSESNSSVLEWIEEITIGPLNNLSGNNGGYADFGDSIAATFTEGETYFYLLDPDFASTLYNEEFRVYFDFNQDGDFSDAGELVISTPGSFSPQFGSIVIPDGITPGITKLRVVMSDSGPTDCGFYSWGETEDYCVMLESVSCDNTSEITGINSTVTDSTVVLSWDPVPTSIGCLINGGPVPTLGVSVQRNGFEVGDITFPRAQIPPGNYNWIVRCACQTLPTLVTTQASEIGYFSVPAAAAPTAPSSRMIAAAELLIAPNPILDQQLKFLYNTENATTYEVVDLLGRKVLSGQLNPGSMHTLALPAELRGNFILLIQDREAIVSKTFNIL